MAITRIYGGTGEPTIPYKRFTFPDGQRHIAFDFARVEYRPTAIIEASFTCADDVLDVLLAANALQTVGRRVSLDIRYLLGARMDRRIGPGQPETLRVIAALIKGGGFDHIRVLDPHSDIYLGLLDAEAVYPCMFAQELLVIFGDDRNGDANAIIIPDQGAKSRIERLLGPDEGGPPRVQCLKNRDLATGRLSGFTVTRPEQVAGKVCLIFDDICDGGGTFVGLAAKLREAGATAVVLFVTHAIMSKGLVLDGIDHIYATDSYKNHGNTTTFTTRPISMENL